jgi:hypothetical protein
MTIIVKEWSEKFAHISYWFKPTTNDMHISGKKSQFPCVRNLIWVPLEKKFCIKYVLKKNPTHNRILLLIFSKIDESFSQTKQFQKTIIIKIIQCLRHILPLKKFIKIFSHHINFIHFIIWLIWQVENTSKPKCRG